MVELSALILSENDCCENEKELVTELLLILFLLIRSKIRKAPHESWCMSFNMIITFFFQVLFILELGR